MSDLTKLAAVSEELHLRMVVECPRGATLKLKYDPKLQAFTVGRALALGLSYPFDWGFIPGTKGEDGDPLDALALHESSTYPGVVLVCRPLGVLDISQNKAGDRIKNPRLILVPIWNETLSHCMDVFSLPRRTREEIERFFVNATLFTDKEPEVEGWRGPDAANELVQDGTRE